MEDSAVRYAILFHQEYSAMFWLDAFEPAKLEDFSFLEMAKRTYMYHPSYGVLADIISAFSSLKKIGVGQLKHRESSALLDSEVPCL